jgi:phage host-nuclease inhibitor protein Gam
MGWMDRLKQTAEKAAAEAEDIAAIGKLKIEIRTLHGKMEDAFKAIGAKVYDLSETGTKFPEEVAALCKKADAFADEIKAKEAQIEKLKASG